MKALGDTEGGLCAAAAAEIASLSADPPPETHTAPSGGSGLSRRGREGLKVVLIHSQRYIPQVGSSSLEKTKPSQLLFSSSFPSIHNKA